MSQNESEVFFYFLEVRPTYTQSYLGNYVMFMFLMISTLQDASFILVTSFFGISPDFLNITVYYVSISTRFCP
jgi:hypothetical protein